MRRHAMTFCLLQCGFWLLAISLTGPGPAWALQKKLSQPNAAADPSKLKELDFDVDAESLASPTPILNDNDETPEGRQRIREVEARARELFRERDDVERERRPIASKRDPLQLKTNQALESIQQSNGLLARLDQRAGQVRRKIQISNGNTKAQLHNELSKLQDQAQFQMQQIAIANTVIQEIAPFLQTLNAQILPLDQRLAKLWSELNEARKQWLTLRQPVEKYARGEFELLRRVLDDWLLIDGLWPAAYTWAALCAYEMDDLEKAADYLDKAQNLRVNVFESTKPWPHLEALSGLIGLKRPGQSAKAQAAIQKALLLMDKKNDWETYFIVGRCYVDREREISRSKANFDKALKIKRDCLCARLWLARVQTTAKQAGPRDVDAGTQALEYLWEKTGKRSWRLGYFLVEAYIAGLQLGKEAKLWDRVLEMAPREQRDQIIANHKKALEKL